MKLPNSSFAPEMSLAIEAALSASEQIMRVYNTRFTHDIKDDKEPVTEADIASDKVIHKILSREGYLILSEESADSPDRLDKIRVWIVDPLDGTSDFVNKTGEFSVMIALVENHIPILGVVFRPTDNTLYIAQKDKGAYKRINEEWHKMLVSSTNDLTKIKAVVSRHHLSKKEELFLEKLGISDFIQMGSAGLKIAEIGAGRADLYFSMTGKMKQWDTAAAHCIIKESGGKITDMLGNDLIYNTKDVFHKNGILVTNNLIHDKILNI